MLQRQQAGAIIAARQRIVEGAVGMVEMALDMLSQQATSSTLDDERKAAMVSNLLVVLCGERGDPAGRQHRHDLPVGRPWPSASRSCCASIREVLDAVQRWADDDLRSLNGADRVRAQARPPRPPAARGRFREPRAARTHQPAAQGRARLVRIGHATAVTCPSPGLGDRPNDRR